MRRERGELPDDAFVVKSLVSTGLADAICASFGVEMRTVPTGFRFIAEQIDLAAKQHKGTFMFGFEESYGFLAGDFVHDKDAISTALLVCEAAIYCESKGSTLWNMLQEIYQKFGCYVEKTKSYTLAGREGMERICRAMSDLRSKTPQQFGAHKVKVLRIIPTEQQRISSLIFLLLLSCRNAMFFVLLSAKAETPPLLSARAEQNPS